MSSSPTGVARNSVVVLRYTLTVHDEVVDSSDDHGPLTVLVGANNIVPGLEAALVGRQVGEEFSVEVPPAEGYGLRQGPGPQPLPRDAFPPDADVEAGMGFVAESEDGELHRLWITEVNDESVLVDRNHPLAGEMLHFRVTVESTRTATPEEVERGQVQAP